VQTLSAERWSRVDQRHFAAEVGSTKCRRIATRPGTDHHHLRLAFDLTHNHN
jgi:hypothetical protein